MAGPSARRWRCGVAHELLDGCRDRRGLLGRGRLPHLDTRPGRALLAIAPHGRDSVALDGRPSRLPPGNHPPGDRAERGDRARSGDGFVEYAGNEWQMPPSLSRCLAERRLPCDAGEGRGSCDSGVGHLVPGQPRGRTAGRDGGDLRLVGGRRRAARARGRARRHGAPHRRGGGRGRPGAGPRGRPHRGHDRLRPPRHLGGALPRRGRVRPGRLLRPDPRRRASSRASSAGRWAGARRPLPATW